MIAEEGLGFKKRAIPGLNNLIRYAIYRAGKSDRISAKGNRKDLTAFFKGVFIL